MSTKRLNAVVNKAIPNVGECDADNLARFTMKPKYVEYYTWDHPEYREFMMDILTNLIPRCQEEGSFIIEENQ